MKLDQTYSTHVWEDAFLRILHEHKMDLEPVIIRTGADSDQMDQVRSFIRSRVNTYYVNLGISCPMPYIHIELLLQMGCKNAMKFIRNKSILHKKAIAQLRRLKEKLTNRSFIVFDNCHHFDFKLIFRVLRLINEFEGKAICVFLLPEGDYKEWIKNRKQSAQLDYFLRLVEHHYEIV